jgi:rod shape-determining protein MreC
VSFPASSQNPLFVEGGLGTLRLMFYLLLAITLMVTDHRQEFLRQFREAVSVLAVPLYHVAASPARLSALVRDGVGSRMRQSEHNRELAEQLIIARARIDRLRAVQQENQRLRELMSGTRGLNLSVQLASVMDIDLDPFRHRVVLDVGATRGVREGLALIDAGGVVGQVIEVGPLTSVALLVSDPSHSVPVQVVRSGLRTIAYGTGSTARLRLPNIPQSADVRVGDELITSGLGGRFPAGLPVGVVDSLSPDDTRLFVVAEATPRAALDRTGEVLLLWTEASAEAVGPPRDLIDPRNVVEEPAVVEQRPDVPVPEAAQ